MLRWMIPQNWAPTVKAFYYQDMTVYHTWSLAHLMILKSLALGVRLGECALAFGEYSPKQFSVKVNFSEMGLQTFKWHWLLSQMTTCCQDTHIFSLFTRERVQEALEPLGQLDLISLTIFKMMKDSCRLRTVLLIPRTGKPLLAKFRWLVIQDVRGHPSSPNETLGD